MSKLPPKRLPPGVSPLKSVIPQLIAKYGVQHERDLEAINKTWKTAVGEPFDAVSSVSGLKRGTLEITVPHNAFAQELQFEQTHILEKLRELLPNEKIKKIKFIVG
jgi:predicted nucleic acid-binding Zn ribbon protein